MSEDGTMKAIRNWQLYMLLIFLAARDGWVRDVLAARAKELA
jgi:hypothetical protein